MTWYEIILIIASALFLLSTISSLFFGDFDLDLGVDGGFLLSDIVSFKGLLHFVLGFTLSLTLFGGITTTSVITGVASGLVFVLALYYLYKLLHKRLQQKMEYKEEISEADAEVYFWSKEQKLGEVFITLEGRPVQVTLKSKDNTDFENGQRIRVSGNRKVVYAVSTN
jgi:hypothetical protein